MSVQLKKILWPVDLSPNSLEPAQRVQQLCLLASAELHVLYVCPAPFVHLDWAVPEYAEKAMVELNKLPRLFRTKLRDLVQPHLPALERVRYGVRSGNAWNEICKYARHADIDMIVVGTHGRTGLPHALIGSVAERIVQHSPCPVLTVPLACSPAVAPQVAGPTANARARISAASRLAGPRRTGRRRLAPGGPRASRS